MSQIDKDQTGDDRDSSNKGRQGLESSYGVCFRSKFYYTVGSLRSGVPKFYRIPWHKLK